MTLHLLLLCIGIGMVAGLRSMMAPALVAWAAHPGWPILARLNLGSVGLGSVSLGSISLDNSPFAFLEATVVLWLLSAAALIELVVDKLPSTPNRTAPLGEIARLVTGGFCGAVLSAAAGQSFIVGAVCGAIGAIAGTHLGFEVRRRLVQKVHVSDFVIAVLEDILAIGGGLLLLSCR